MTSELQRDIEAVEWVMAERTDDEPWAAWQRLKPLLTPDRERVARAIRLRYFGAPDSWEALDSHARNDWLNVADAAIAAIRGGE